MALPVLDMPEWVEASTVRKEVHKDIWAVIRPLMRSGWTARRAGHKFYLYCPCGGAGSTRIAIPGTPRDAGNAARRIGQQAGHCPERHDLP